MDIGAFPHALTTHSHELHLSDPVAGDDRVLRLQLAGVLDGLNANRFVDAFTAALHEGGQTTDEVIIDVAGLTFLDSAGIRALLQSRKAADRAGQRLRLRDPQPVVLQILGITGLLSHFSIEA